MFVLNVCTFATTMIVYKIIIFSWLLLVARDKNTSNVTPDKNTKAGHVTWSKTNSPTARVRVKEKHLSLPFIFNDIEKQGVEPHLNCFKTTKVNDKSAVPIMGELHSIRRARDQLKIEPTV